MGMLRGLAEAGADVVMHGLVTADEAKAKTSEIAREFGVQCRHSAADVTKPADIRYIHQLPVTTADYYESTVSSHAAAAGILSFLDQLCTYKSGGRGFPELELISAYCCCALVTWTGTPPCDHPSTSVMSQQSPGCVQGYDQGHSR